MSKLDIAVHNLNKLVDLYTNKPALKRNTSLKDIDNYIAMSMMAETTLKNDMSIHNVQQYAIMMDKLIALMDLLDLDNLKVMLMKQSLLVQTTFVKIKDTN